MTTRTKFAVLYAALFLFLLQFILGCQFFVETPQEAGPEKKIGDYMNLTPEQAKEMLDKDYKVILLDVREPDEFMKEHIKGAINISLYELESAIDNKLWPKDAKIICYDSNGSSSRTAAKSLIGSGYVGISNLAGGINAWKAANLPVVE